MTLFDATLKNYFEVAYTNEGNWNITPEGSAEVSIDQGVRFKYDWRGVLTLAPGQILIMGLEDRTERLEVHGTTAQESNRAGYFELQSQIAKRFFFAAKFGLTPRRSAPDYTVVNVAANCKVDDRATLFGRIDNLFNEHYEDPTGFGCSRASSSLANTAVKRICCKTEAD